MFTGIVECIGIITEIKPDNKNLQITVQSAIASELKPDQSVNHNGVCLTVISTGGSTHTVTAVNETLLRSNLNSLRIGDLINLERAMPLNGRLDGHLVQGHVDETAECVSIEDKKGSWLYSFKLKSGQQPLLIEKGSVSINGISLTAFDLHNHQFSVAVIPYTFEHTNFKNLKQNHLVNIEFDVIGKYVAKWMEYIKTH